MISSVKYKIRLLRYLRTKWAIFPNWVDMPFCEIMGIAKGPYS